MEFPVPQFIEREAKIAGPLTFRQFIFLGLAGLFLFIIYFSLAKRSLLAFIVLSVVLITIVSALAFLKISGRPLTTVLGNLFSFFTGSKIYLWKKAPGPSMIFKKERELKKRKEDEPSSLRIVEKSQLKQLATKIETRTR